MSHDRLANMYYMNFQLMQHHGYSLWEIENMIAFERSVYITFLRKYLEEEKERMKQKGMKVE